MRNLKRHCEHSEAIQNHKSNFHGLLRQLCLLAMTIIPLTACGFHPVYGVNKYTPVGVETKLAQVQIGGIPDREGQYLRNALIDRFYRDGRPAQPVYALKLEPVTESRKDLDVTIDADSTRGQLRLNSNITLIDNRTGKEVLKRDIQSITSYNILASEFTNRVSEQNARENALDDMARQIENYIILYFKHTQ